MAKKKLGDIARADKRLKPLLKLLEGSKSRKILEYESGDDADWRDHMHAAKKMCEDGGDYETAKKIHGLMKPVDMKEDDAMEDEEITKGAGEKGSSEDAAPSRKASVVEDDEKEEKVDEDDEEEKAAESDAKRKGSNPESRRTRRSSDPHVRAIQEKLDLAELKEWIREKCEKKSLPCDQRLMESLVKLREHKAIESHLDYLKDHGISKRQPGRATGQFDPRRLTESRAGRPAESVDEFVSILRGS